MRDTDFETFANEIVRKNVDPYKLSLARIWYKKFTGKSSLTVDEKELVDMYETIH